MMIRDTEKTADFEANGTEAKLELGPDLDEERPEIFPIELIRFHNVFENEDLCPDVPDEGTSHLARSEPDGINTIKNNDGLPKGQRLARWVQYNFTILIVTLLQ